jgi:hypothetical protein
LNYAYVHSAADKAVPGRVHGHLYLTPYPREKLFGKKFGDWDKIRQRAVEELKSNHKPWIIERIAASQASEFLTTPGRLTIGHCSFASFAEALQVFSDQTAIDSVESRLYRGLLSELERRMTQLGVSPAAEHWESQETRSATAPDLQETRRSERTREKSRS